MLAVAETHLTPTVHAHIGMKIAVIYNRQSRKVIDFFGIPSQPVLIEINAIGSVPSIA